MTPDELHARRRALGLTVAQLAKAARMRAVDAADPSYPSAVRLDATLRRLERGATIEEARAASMPGKRGPKPTVVSRETSSPAPPWPEHSGGVERLSGQCFRDVATHDYSTAPMRPASLPRRRPGVVLGKTVLGC